jgi:hypothetical protein
MYGFPQFKGFQKRFSVASPLTDQMIVWNINCCLLFDKFPESFHNLDSIDLLLFSLELITVLDGEKSHFDNFFYEEILFDQSGKEVEYLSRRISW